MRRLLKVVLLHWLVLAVVVGVTAWLLPSVEIDGGPFALIGVAAVVGLVNAVIGPVLRLLTIPLTVATLGLFALVINGLLLMIAAGLSDRLSVGGPLATIGAALVLSVLSALGHLVLSRVLLRGEPAH